MKRGFTLIELMAVIVVLGILATISVISVDKIIKENKEETYKAQIATIEDAARTWGVKHIKELPDNDGDAISVPLLYFKNEGIISNDFKNSKTNKPFNDDLYVDISYEGGVYIYKVAKTSGLGTETNPKLLTGKYNNGNIKTYTNGEVVYFNVTTGEECSSSDYTEAQSNTGVKDGCMKFYAFNDNGEDTVNLILDHNTTATVAWNNTYTNDSGTKINSKGPKQVLDKLKADTDLWQGIITPSNYTMDQTGQTSNAKYTIDYSSYKARLITAQEIATITGNISWDEKTASSYYYFDSKTTTASDTCKSGNTTGCSYGWLYDRTYKICKIYGCLNNSDSSTSDYWTASSSADYSNSARYVSYRASMSSSNVSGSRGVRPVIEVLKSKLQ